MPIQELYNTLMDAFSDQNLNEITRKLILLYKKKNYAKLREYANKISRYIPISEANDARCFAKLIMLYHPDKGDQTRKTLKALLEKNDFDGLQQQLHILLMSDIEEVELASVTQEVDYQPEYVWDTNNEAGFSYSNFEDGSNEVNEEESPEFDKSFYNLIKIREYGDVNVEFPTYYLEDFEDFEMSYSGLESLDGVQYCKHVKVLDVSNNSISDIDYLWNLEHLEELYLANNMIGFIDALGNLTHLKTLDLSGNEVDDITPLLDLEELEYVNLIGNSVPSSQLRELKKKGVLVMH